MADIAPSHESTPTPDPPAPPAPPAPKSKSKSAASTFARYHYCLEEGHPGAPNFQTQPLSATRIFGSNDDGAPTCPACGKEVNAIPCEGPDIPPEYILSLQERFGR